VNYKPIVGLTCHERSRGVREAKELQKTKTTCSFVWGLASGESALAGRRWSRSGEEGIDTMKCGEGGSWWSGSWGKQN